MHWMILSLIFFPFLSLAKELNVTLHDLAISPGFPEDFEGYDGYGPKKGTSLLIRTTLPKDVLAIDADRSRLLSVVDDKGFNLLQAGLLAAKKEDSPSYGPKVNQFQSKRLFVHKKTKDILIGVHVLATPSPGARSFLLKGELAGVTQGQKKGEFKVAGIPFKSDQTFQVGQTPVTLETITRLTYNTKKETKVSFVTSFLPTKAVLMVQGKGTMFMGGGAIKKTSKGFDLEFKKDLPEGDLELHFEGYEPKFIMLQFEKIVSLGIASLPLAH